MRYVTSSTSMEPLSVALSIYGSQQTVSGSRYIHSTEGLRETERGGGGGGGRGEKDGEGKRKGGGREELHTM